MLKYGSHATNGTEGGRKFSAWAVIPITGQKHDQEDWAKNSCDFLFYEDCHFKKIANVIKVMAFAFDVRNSKNTTS